MSAGFCRPTVRTPRFERGYVVSIPTSETIGLIWSLSLELKYFMDRVSSIT